ncbi:hypothetical protein A2335_02315 [Candidatus Peregrinibacteria bacterium RIFOXYB2_FULL_32_7]|nr:MAG: hypothetical protein A2335_02315 [Candidatus Peregrinibacteria bacterium RIFOXYB2_FULL_32_7]
MGAETEQSSSINEAIRLLKSIEELTDPSAKEVILALALKTARRDIQKRLCPEAERMVKEALILPPSINNIFRNVILALTVAGFAVAGTIHLGDKIALEHIANEDITCITDTGNLTDPKSGVPMRTRTFPNRDVYLTLGVCPEVETEKSE